MISKTFFAAVAVAAVATSTSINAQQQPTCAGFTECTVTTTASAAGTVARSTVLAIYDAKGDHHFEAAARVDGVFAIPTSSSSSPTSPRISKLAIVGREFSIFANSRESRCAKSWDRILHHVVRYRRQQNHQAKERNGAVVVAVLALDRLAENDENVQKIHGKADLAQVPKHDPLEDL
ncbi:hypothetical protein ON010_g13296 [Phytophthora cinnamomi]|nr:hypothetical protein ON010_g13296 [Phytophthora cinnamomi]